MSETTTLPYRHDSAACFADRVGAAGLDRAAFETTLARTGAALAELRARRDDGTLPLLGLPRETGDLARLEPVARRFRKLRRVVVLGTGGSSLGGATLCRLVDHGFGPPAGTPRLAFLDNVDPAPFEALLAQPDLAETGFIVISKSGGTAETLCQAMICLDRLAATVGKQGLAERVTAVAEAGDSPLRRMAGKLGVECLDHDPRIGGRYSVLSLTGLLPAMIAGLDARAVRAGAAAVLDPALAPGADPATVAPAVGAAINVGLADSGTISQTVLMPYLDALAPFSRWFRQLWAESLGKEGHGTTPIAALGTVDQHSQLQLYLGGPADKLFTLVLGRVAGTGERVPESWREAGGPDYLLGRTMGDLLEAEQRATAETLIRNGRPTRTITIDRLDERALGGLFMHFMLETMVAAHLWGIDAFDQPAVEEGKVLARQYLAGG